MAPGYNNQPTPLILAAWCICRSTKKTGTWPGVLVHSARAPPAEEERRSGVCMRGAGGDQGSRSRKESRFR